MSLIINHNLMAENALRNLGSNYKKLNTSVQRLSSGLRINSAADDAAGLAIREMMRADIATMQQGVRNASDAISLIQTAEGAMAVIDEKLTRMKELAEQSATGTYTTAQREIINSEYQAMAAEIDRIANSTNFNGVKLLDGSLANQNGGQGLRIHFGTSNNAAEDYYFINIGDVRATVGTGLRVGGGDPKNDIWAQGGAARAYGAAAGCCAGGYSSLTGRAFASGTAFSFGYNWDLGSGAGTNGANLAGGKYTAGLWDTSGASLADLIGKVNAGSQARVGITMSAVGAITNAAAGMSALGICFGDELYYFGNGSAVSAAQTGKTIHRVSGAATANTSALVSAINHNASSNFWAMKISGTNTAYIFCKDGGQAGNGLVACEQSFGTTSALLKNSALDQITFENVGGGQTNQSGVNFSLGGEHWGTLAATQAGSVWNLTLTGRDVGAGRDLWIGDIKAGKLETSRVLIGKSTLKSGRLLERDYFAEVQNAADALWAGSDIRSQDSAQKSLDALDQAIEKKDKVRATLGAYQNRLENTISNLEIQAENLQAAESRISDADVAREITNLTKNTVLVQAATSMVAQANSLNNLALSLLNR